MNILQKEVVKTKEVVKICKKHGNLYEEDVTRYKESRIKCGFIIKCKTCRREQIWNGSVTCKTHGVLSEFDIKSNGRCKRCHRESASSKRNSNREWFNEKMNQDRIKNPEKWQERYKKAYQYSKEKYGDQRIVNEIIRVKGITQEKYESMFVEQENRCKICHEHETRVINKKVTRLVVDHCHKTGIVRGLLCAKCNLMISYADDSKDILEMAIIYLDEFDKLESKCT